jgi:putative flippase GtrA
MTAVNPWRLLFQQMAQYLVVAVVAFALDFGIYMGLVGAGLSPLVAAPFGFIGGLLCNYVLATQYVFTHRRLRSRSLEFFTYGVIGLLGLGLNEVIIAMFYQWLHQSPGVAKLVAAGVVFGFNFSARRAALFSPGSKA